MVERRAQVWHPLSILCAYICSMIRHIQICSRKICFNFDKNLTLCAVILLPIFYSEKSNAASPIVVVGKDFTEQVIVTELTRQLLLNRGYAVDRKIGLTTSQLHQHMALGSGDIYWEYTSTRLILAYGEQGKLSNEAGFDKIRELDRKNGYLWLKPTKVNNQYALAVRSKMADDMGLHTISDLAALLERGGTINFGVNDEFAERLDGFDPLRQAYGLNISDKNITNIETDRIYNALKVFWIDVGVVFSTDGRINEYKFSLLEDDKNFFYNYILAPVIKKETAEANPDLVNALESLSSRLDNATITRLNAEADVGRRLVKDVASEFLKETGLVKN